MKAWDELTEAEQGSLRPHHGHLRRGAWTTWTAPSARSVDGLKQRGVLDNTLILFLTDNGGNAESGPNGRSQGRIRRARPVDVFCGQSWATLENTPFRRYKHFNHEGGIATPLIAHWPAGITAQGELRQQPGHLVDIMATCVDVAAPKYPTEFNGHAIQPMEGRSLVPAFANKPIERDALYWEHEGNAAIRVGDWKLVRRGGKGAWELYDLKTDRTEQKNLAATHAEKAKELAAAWDAWAKRAYVVPGPARFGGDGTEVIPDGEATPKAPAKAGAKPKRAAN